jgi:hypothetical protein
VLKSDSKYPSRRAYVVKVRSDATPGALRGRVENLLTCRHHDFASARELVELLEADLQALGPPSGAP